MEGTDTLIQTSPCDDLGPPLTVAEFQSRAAALLAGAQIDVANNFEQKDLHKLIARFDIKGRDAVVCATIYQMYRRAPVAYGHSIDATGHLDSSAEYVRFGTAEIKALRQPTSHDLLDLRTLSQLSTAKTFSLADVNQDGYLSFAELLNNPGHKTLWQNLASVRKLYDEQLLGLTQADFAGIYAREKKIIDASDDMLQDAAAALERLRAVTVRTLFGDDDFPLVDIDMEDFVQGFSEDAYFQSILSMVAKHNPELIKNAISEKEAGIFSVRFAGAAAIEIVITAPTDTELAMSARPGAVGFWPTVIEKAFDVYRKVLDTGREAGAVKLLTGELAHCYMAKIATPPPLLVGKPIR